MSLRAADQTEIETLLKQYSDAMTAQGKPTLKVYPLEHVLSATDVTTFQSLVPDAKVTLSTDGRRLHVVARAEDQTSVESLIKQLEQAATQEGKPELAVYPLKRPLNPTVLASFTTLVPGAQVTISADTKQLIVVARAEDQALIKKTLDQIATSTDAAARQQLEIYQVDGIPATQLQTLLQPLAVESTMTIDTPLDRLIVWGPDRRTPGVCRGDCETHGRSAGRHETGAGVLSPGGRIAVDQRDDGHDNAGAYREGHLGRG